MDEVNDTPRPDDAGEDESDGLSNTLHDTGLNNTNTTPNSQQEQVSDKERSLWKTRKASRRIEGSHSTTASTSSRMPFSHIPSTHRQDIGFRPPLIMPEWDTYGRDPTIIAKQEHVTHPNIHDQSPQEVFGSIPWSNVHQGMEVTSTFPDHCLISPTHMVNTSSQNAYLNDCFPGPQHQHFAGMPQSQFDRSAEYRTDLHDPRSGQTRIQMYNAFAAQSSPTHELVQRVYYPM